MRAWSDEYAQRIARAESQNRRQRREMEELARAESRERRKREELLRQEQVHGGAKVTYQRMVKMVEAYIEDRRSRKNKEGREERKGSYAAQGGKGICYQYKENGKCNKKL